jgi:hypothetical protein
MARRKNRPESERRTPKQINATLRRAVENLVQLAQQQERELQEKDQRIAHHGRLIGDLAEALAHRGRRPRADQRKRRALDLYEQGHKPSEIGRLLRDEDPAWLGPDGQPYKRDAVEKIIERERESRRTRRLLGLE